MNIAVIGGGRVGLPTAAGLAMLGHCVVYCECDSNKRNIAAEGLAPFADSGLDNALTESVKSGMLRFCADGITKFLDWYSYEWANQQEKMI